MEPVPEPNHVFISYAHLDDDPPPEIPKGWVSYFDETLSNFLTRKLGKRARVWRDPAMDRTAIYDEEIFENLLQSLTLVSVVSPGYIQSEYCLKELAEFRKTVAPIGTKSRVFKVIKFPLEEGEEMPVLLRDINSFDFYQRDKQTRIPREFGFEFGQELREQFLLKVSDLAYEISTLLKVIERNPIPSPADRVVPASLVTPSKVVYLAETSNDFQVNRDSIRRDLLERDYTVLPVSDVVPPHTTDAYKQFVRDNIANCGLAIHLIGRDYGEVPTDGAESYIHLQSDVAAERDSDPNFYRIIWIPKDADKSQPRHEKFINDIWDASAKDVEVLEKPLEELKTNILDALNRETKPEKSREVSSAKPSVFVLYDKIDAVEAAAVEGYIEKAGFNVWSAAKYLSSESADLIQAQNYYLINCDGVLIYWNNAPDYWVQINVQKLLKIFGEGRQDDFLGEALFVASGNTVEEIESDADLLTNFEDLDTFLGKIKAAFQERFNRRGRK